jgi:cytochrome P450
VAVSPILVISDPDIIEELYVTKNKFFDKNIRLENQFKCLFGAGTVFSKSNELQAEKRKHLSVAFYRERMVKMLNMLTSMTESKVKQWTSDYADQEGKELNLIREISDLINDSI